MDIVTAEQIRRSGAHDIPAVLARYTSLDVQQYNAHDYSVGVRAFTTPMAQRLLVLVNGRQVYLDHYGYAAWDSIPVQLSEIRQIEVVKGPNSALFGFNAASGVINIVTYDPSYDRVTAGVLRTGGGRYREASGVATAPIGDNGGIRISAGLRAERAWAHGYSDFEAQELNARRSPSRNQIAAEAVFRPAPAVRTSIDASYSRAIGGDFMDYGQVWREDKRVWSLRGKVSADTAFGTVESQVYHNALKATYAATEYTTDAGLTVFDLSDTVKLGSSHTVRPMVQYRHATMTMLPGAEVHYNVFGTGAMWNWLIALPLEATTSVRYDRLWLGATGYDDPAFPYGNSDYDRSFGELSWNLGLAWRATDLDTLRLSAARGVSLPSLSDYGWRDSYPEFGYQDTGTPTISPTIVDSYEAGYRRKVEQIAGKVDVTVFYQRYSGFSSGLSSATFLPPAVPLDTYTPYNLGNARVIGSEVSASGLIGGDYSWGLRYRLSTVSSDFTSSSQDPKRASPRHLISARVGWSRGPVEVDLFGRYSSLVRGYRSMGEIETSLVEVKDWVSVAGRAAYQIGERMTLAVEGENLLHGHQEQTLATKAMRRIYISLTTNF
jgi:iron complex outermembrane receptor protein